VQQQRSVGAGSSDADPLRIDGLGLGGSTIGSALSAASRSGA